MTNAAQKRFVAAWSIMETYFCCGVIFGWPNLKKIFIEEGFFLNMNCTMPEALSTGESEDLNIRVTVRETSENNKSDGFCDDNLVTHYLKLQEAELTEAYGYACIVFALVGVPV